VGERTVAAPAEVVASPSAVSAAHAAVLSARAEVDAAREGLAGEYDLLGKSARDAVDIPAKIRRAPVQSAALAGGAVFLVLGGPGRVFGRVKRAIVGTPSPLPKSMLPKDVDRALRGLGDNGDLVRGALERSFADYLDSRGSFAQRQVRNAATESIASTIRLASRAVGLTLVRRVLAGDTDQIDEMIARAKGLARSGQGGADPAGSGSTPGDGSPPS
jgi:hypothetical protein